MGAHKFTKEEARKIKISMARANGFSRSDLNLSDEANQKFADYLNKPLIDILQEDAEG